MKTNLNHIKTLKRFQFRGLNECWVKRQRDKKLGSTKVE